VHHRRQCCYRYYLESKKKQYAEARRDVLLCLSPALKMRATWDIYRGALSRLPFLKADEVSRPFLVKLALHLETMVYAPKELTLSRTLNIVVGGSASYRGEIRRPGDSFGASTILLRSAWQFRATALTCLQRASEPARHFPLQPAVAQCSHQARAPAATGTCTCT
jgi:hypothetical protein